MYRTLAKLFRGGLRPSLADVLFASIVARVLVFSGGWSALLDDGDTGWHIRTGDWMLQHLSVPHNDLFSFSRAREPWFAWEWLSDLIMALVHRQWALAGVAVLAVCIIAIGAMVLFRHMLWRGANVVVAFCVLYVAVGACSIHYLARPHIFTLLLTAVALWMLERDRRHPSPAVWLLVPLSAVWVNLHGGFFALPATLAVLSAGYWIEAWVNREQRCLRRAAGLRYAALTGATIAASLINPYGIALHRHVASYLSSDWIRNVVQEFQSPSFRSEGILLFELLLFATLLLSGVLLARKNIADVLLSIFWAHMALASARHVPVFALVCAPLLAVEISRLWEAWVGRRSPRSAGRILWTLGTDFAASFRRFSLWAPAFAVAVILLSSGKRPEDFPDSRFPVALVRTEASRLVSARVFTSDQWGDYLIYKGWPKQRVFFDGRSDFYGPSIGDEYIRLMSGRRGWEKLLDKYEITVALMPLDWPLVSLLDQHPGWKRIREDKMGVLYEHPDDRVNSPANPR